MTIEQFLAKCEPLCADVRVGWPKILIPELNALGVPDNFMRLVNSVSQGVPQTEDKRWRLHYETGGYNSIPHQVTAAILEHHFRKVVSEMDCSVMTLRGGRTVIKNNECDEIADCATAREALTIALEILLKGD